ncbi:MAG: cation diffusion facilitator family transporter [Anaerolineae bacterium]
MHQQQNLTRFAWLSIGVAVFTIALKAGAYLLTGSVGLLSDALESGVNLLAAVFALIMLTIAAMPPDEEHAYGHTKAEYFSSGAEGTLILVAAVTIIVSVIRRLSQPQPLEQLGIGVIISGVAAVSNFVVARILLQAGRRYNSVTLSADAHHLMTDVLTSAGVLVGIGAVAVTGWNILDPLIALVVAAQIIFAGVRLVRQSVRGLMDTALPKEELERVEAVLEAYHNRRHIHYHALRSRQSGAHRFVSVHVLVPGTWTVQEGHALLDDLERDICDILPDTSVFTHLEPLDDASSNADLRLGMIPPPPR